MKLLQVTAKEKEIIEKNRYIQEEDHSVIDYRNKVCVKPWGYEYLVYESKKIGMWYLLMKKGHSTSLHTHFKKDTIIIVLSGCAKIGLLDAKPIVLNTLESIYIPKYKFHSIASFSQETVILEMEIFTEKLSFSDKNDLLRLDDQYNRKAVGYESSVNILTENLETYSPFSIKDNHIEKHGVSLEYHTVKSEDDLTQLRNKSYTILLEGQLFSDCQYIKEGSILNIKEHPYSPIYECKVLTIDKLLWQEDAKIIYDFEQLRLIKDEILSQKKKIVLTSGCFDILHVGHLETLKRAKMLGDTLIVCLSSDEQIRSLKGSTRPINNYEDRINLFKTITYVDYIVLYNEENIPEEQTLGTIMKIVDPSTWVKGSDYTVEEISKKHPYLRNITILPLVDQKSTTSIVKKILES